MAALRDAVKSAFGSKGFSTPLYNMLHREDQPERKFDAGCDAVAHLPRRQTACTWMMKWSYGMSGQRVMDERLAPDFL